MRLPALLDRRPILVAVAGPNGAGKSTFIRAHLGFSGLRIVNADVVAGELDLDAYAAARAADAIRRVLVSQRESFIFETVFSDPAGEKRGFLRDAAASGYTVLLCFIGLASPALSEERVAMRVSQGGHDVPDEKLKSRFPRTLANLKAAVLELPHVLVYDNSDLGRSYRFVAEFAAGRCVGRGRIPRWSRGIL